MRRTLPQQAYRKASHGGLDVDAQDCLKPCFVLRFTASCCSAHRILLLSSALSPEWDGAGPWKGTKTVNPYIHPAAQRSAVCQNLGAHKASQGSGL